MQTATDVELLNDLLDERHRLIRELNEVESAIVKIRRGYESPEPLTGVGRFIPPEQPFTL